MKNLGRDYGWIAECYYLHKKQLVPLGYHKVTGKDRLILDVILIRQKTKLIFLVTRNMLLRRKTL